MKGVSVSLRFKYRGVEQLVARRAHNPKVIGSSPVPATKKKPCTCVQGFFILYCPGQGCWNWHNSLHIQKCPITLGYGAFLID